MAELASGRDGVGAELGQRSRPDSKCPVVRAAPRAHLGSTSLQALCAPRYGREAQPGSVGCEEQRHERASGHWEQ